MRASKGRFKRYSVAEPEPSRLVVRARGFYRRATAARVESAPMSYFVVVPGALVPAPIAPPLLARARPPFLARRLRHAQANPPQVLTGDGAAHLDWLWAQFGAPEERPITAPYAWRALNRTSAIDVPSDQPLWQADPVHFALARDRLLVTQLDAEAAVTPDESRALAAEAAPILAGFNATLRVIDSYHW